MWWFDSSRKVPPRIPTDTVVPLGYYDDSAILTSFVVSTLFKFDNVLDAASLEQSLQRLLQCEGWRKLGARLRRNSHGRLEYHVPASFSAARPGFLWMSEHIDCNMQDHDEACRFPEPSEAPKVVGVCDFCDSLTFSPKGPQSLDDFLTTDVPALTVRVTTFRNGTTLALSWLHTWMDAMSAKIILNAWTLVLAGREDEILPLHAMDIDPLASLGTRASMTEWVVYPLWLGGFSRIIMALRVLYQSLMRQDVTSKLICLPHAHLRALREQAEADARFNDEQSQTSVPFISDGDLIMAYMARLRARAGDLGTTLVVLFAFSARDILANDLLPQDKAYVGNVSGLLYTLFTVKTILESSAAWLPRQFRHAIQEQGTRQQQECAFNAQRFAVEKHGHPPLIGDAWSTILMFSNWSKAKFFDVDFSPAVVAASRSRSSASSLAGKPTFVNAAVRNTSLMLSANSVIIQGKDHHGNYWLSAAFHSNVWKVVEEAMASEST